MCNNNGSFVHRKHYLFLFHRLLFHAAHTIFSIQKYRELCDFSFVCHTQNEWHCLQNCSKREKKIE